jgi:hypothetical protein
MRSDLVRRLKALEIKSGKTPKIDSIMQSINMLSDEEFYQQVARNYSLFQRQFTLSESFWIGPSLNDEKLTILSEEMLNLPSDDQQEEMSKSSQNNTNERVS